MNVDDLVVMMNLLDTDGDGTVTKLEFGVYYKRLKQCDDAAFEAAWKLIDGDGDGNLTLNELCKYYGVDTNNCATALKKYKSEMDDEKILEALQLQSLLQEEQQRHDKQVKTRADRLRALAELAEEEMEAEAEAGAEEEETSFSTPVVAGNKKKAATAAVTPLTMEEITRDAKRRGDLAPHHFANSA